MTETLRYEEIQNGTLHVQQDIPYDRATSKPKDLGDGAIRYCWTYHLGNHVQAVLEVRKTNCGLPGGEDPDCAENVYFREACPCQITIEAETRMEPRIEYPHKSKLTKRERESLESLLVRVENWHWTMFSRDLLVELREDRKPVKDDDGHTQLKDAEAERQRKAEARLIKRSVGSRRILKNGPKRKALVSFLVDALSTGLYARHAEQGRATFPNGKAITFVPCFDSSLSVTPKGAPAVRHDKTPDALTIPLGSETAANYDRDAAILDTTADILRTGTASGSEERRAQSAAFGADVERQSAERTANTLAAEELERHRAANAGRKAGGHKAGLKTQAALRKERGQKGRREVLDPCRNEFQRLASQHSKQQAARLLLAKLRKEQPTAWLPKSAQSVVNWYNVNPPE